MLILARKKGESINIGQQIKIVVLESSKDQVKLGIEAPAEIDVYRTEIYNEIQKENASALTVNKNYLLKNKEKMKKTLNLTQNWPKK